MTTPMVVTIDKANSGMQGGKLLVQALLDTTAIPNGSAVTVQVIVYKKSNGEDYPSDYFAMTT